MLLQKYLQTINEINPNKIYVENIRRALHVPTGLARLLCEMAVVDKQFEKKIGLLCPGENCNGRILASYSNEYEIPYEIECDICESEDVGPITYKTEDLEKITFYRLIKSR